ncbi:hypothetical protein ARMGADRAFT_876297, partial [Armillaria gallica]
DTHYTVYRGPDNKYIPNFVGAVLPRHDHGDYEYYCCMMVQRTQAFMSFKFTSYQLDIMKNFNLRYECLDACDNFRAELKKGTTEAPGW